MKSKYGTTPSVMLVGIKMNAPGMMSLCQFGRHFECSVCLICYSKIMQQKMLDWGWGVSPTVRKDRSPYSRGTRSECLSLLTWRSPRPLARRVLLLQSGLSCGGRRNRCFSPVMLLGRGCLPRAEDRLTPAAAQRIYPSKGG